MTQASIAELMESWRHRNTDRYNLHPIVTHLKAHKGGPSEKKKVEEDVTQLPSASTPL